MFEESILTEKGGEGQGSEIGEVKKVGEAVDGRTLGRRVKVEGPEWLRSVRVVARDARRRGGQSKPS